jgi:hypothetical protein
MRRETAFLIVTTRMRVAALVAEELGAVAFKVAGADEAEAIVATEVLAGMVVDVACDPGASRRLARFYLGHQPMGRVVLLSHLEDITTLTAFAVQDGRIDLFFEPWNLAHVRQFLGVAAPVG